MITISTLPLAVCLLVISGSLHDLVSPHISPQSPALVAHTASVRNVWSGKVAALWVLSSYELWTYTRIPHLQKGQV